MVGKSAISVQNLFIALKNAINNFHSIALTLLVIKNLFTEKVGRYGNCEITKLI